MRFRNVGWFAAIVAGSFVVGCGADTTQDVDVSAAAVSGSPQLYTPVPNDGAKKQIVALQSSGNAADADLIRKMIATPQAAWFTQGTPASVEHDVHVTVSRALNQGTPVLVAYNIPFRDCAQFSAGGATNATEYAAWITVSPRASATSRPSSSSSPTAWGSSRGSPPTTAPGPIGASPPRPIRRRPPPIASPCSRRRLRA